MATKWVRYTVTQRNNKSNLILIYQILNHQNKERLRSTEEGMDARTSSSRTDQSRSAEEQQKAVAFEQIQTMSHRLNKFE